MRILIGLVLVLLGCTHAEDDEGRCYKVYPKRWHFLDPNQPGERAGLLLAEIDGDLYTVLPGDENPYKEICNGTDYIASKAEEHLPDHDEKIQQFPCFFYEDGAAWYCKNSSCLDHVYLKCDQGDTTDPDWEVAGGTLLWVDDSGEAKHDTPEGLLLVYLNDRNGHEEMIGGTVCDDGFDDHAANLVCQQLGYKHAADWGSEPQNQRYVPYSVLEEHDIPILIDDVRCSNETTNIMQCEAKVAKGHDCSISENLWLKCSSGDDDDDTEPEWEIENAFLVWLDENEEDREGPEGLLVVHVAVNNDYEQMKVGTVCDNGFNDHAANLACQKLGYRYAADWGSEPRNREFIPLSVLEKYNVTIAVDDVRCSNGTTDILECEAKIMEGHDCSHSEDLWLKCSSGDDDDDKKPDWELIDANLIWMNEYEEAINGTEGLLVVVFEDRNGHEETKVGTVCDDGFNDHAANLACKQLGYKYAAEWGSEPQNFEYVPSSILEKYDVPILIDDVRCSNGTTNIMQCEAKLMEGNDCSWSENLWLKCSSGDDDDDDEDEDEGLGGLELEFGGAKLTLNLNKLRRKWIF